MFYPNTPFLSKQFLESEILKINVGILPHILQWLCKTPCITTYRINTLRTTPAAYKIALEDKLKAIYGAKAPKVYGIPELPEILCIAPLEAPSSIECDNKLKELIVDTSCGAAVLRGAHIYAPGVLAMETGTQPHEYVNIYADLSAKCKRGTATRYESAEKIYLGVGEVLMQRYQLYNNNPEPPTGIAVHMRTNVSGVPPLGDLSDANALLQNLPSIVCVRVLAPQPGECILDMCAAPGNKTTHIAELMRNEGHVIALDNSANRVRSMQTKLLNYSCIEAHVFDSTKAYDAMSERTLKPPFPTHSFDRILLDAPCSGLGNRPQLACGIKQLKVLQSYPHIQRHLFEQAVPLLKPGGVLVYSTCTVTEAECEQIVAWVIRKFPELNLVDAQPQFGGPALPNLGLSEAQCKLVQRFGPSVLDTVGFFIAKFEKSK